RNFSRHPPHLIFLQLFNSRQPRLERRPPAHARVHFISRIHPAQRKIRKRPLSRIKAIPLIDKRRRVLLLPHLPPESRLPSALHVHLSSARIPANVSRFLTRSSISGGK